MDTTMKEHKISKGILGFFLNAVLLVFSISCIFPLFWMFYSSLKEKRAFNADNVGLPKSPTLENYQRILANPDYHLLESMMNSLRTALLSVALIIICGFIVGYILSRIRFKGNRILYVMFLMGLLIPVHSLLVPIYLVFKATNLSNQWFTLIIPYVAFGLPIAIFLVEGYIKAIPTDLEEAAAIDGSNFSRTLFTIILPVCLSLIHI